MFATRRVLAALVRQEVRQGRLPTFAAAGPRSAAASSFTAILASTSRLFNSAVPNTTEPTSSSTVIGEDKMGVLFTLHNRPGALQEALKFFWKHDVNITRIESRPSKHSVSEFDLVLDFQGPPEDPRTKALLDDLRTVTKSLTVLGVAEVPWFPRTVADLDLFSQKTLDAGTELEADHPGFSDADYRRRREEIVEHARKFRTGMQIYRVPYSKEETATWGVVYNRLLALYPKYACKEYLAILPDLERECGYAANNIPQLQDISDFLKKRTGFSLRPVGGLLSARDFLNALAFKVFYSTQYIRHHSRPLYTPEPDIMHELMGHAPMFADPSFAEFSHEIGLASLGASDEDIKRLATCYWFSVEFGVCFEGKDLKAYGAGLLSSFGELEHAMSGKPEVRAWDPFKACLQEYPITTYQPVYFAAKSFEDAKSRMIQFSGTLARPFHVRYIPATQSIELDRKVAVHRNISA